ncbi:hypothetical protein [Citromicrobium bathyomarinum]|uniref:hypothetical protein n=1 Tax=Citromicrobium bathyomarinum TaxID=72174 RepID=UPI00315B1D4D
MSRSAMIPDAFDTAADLASVSQAERWRPGLGAVAQSEIFASGCEGSGAGAALALALDAWRSRPRAEGEEVEDRRGVVWVQTRAAVKRGGRPFRPGLPPEIRHRLIHVIAEKDEDALFALEEAVRCRDIAFVIGEIVGSPRALDFTASRRLTLAAERHGIPLTLVRLDGTRDLSSARQRWAVQAAPSARPQWNRQAPGVPAWQAELFRARSHPPGTWRLSEDAGRLVVERGNTPEIRPIPIRRARHRNLVNPKISVRAEPVEALSFTLVGATPEERAALRQAQGER